MDALEDLYGARDAARRAAALLRGMADALDELGPAPVQYPSEHEVRSLLERIGEAEARLRNCRQVHLIDTWLARARGVRRVPVPRGARSLPPHG